MLTGHRYLPETHSAPSVGPMHSHPDELDSVIHRLGPLESRDPQRSSSTVRPGLFLEHEPSREVGIQPLEYSTIHSDVLQLREHDSTLTTLFEYVGNPRNPGHPPPRAPGTHFSTTSVIPNSRQPPVLVTQGLTTFTHSPVVRKGTIIKRKIPITTTANRTFRHIRCFHTIQDLFTCTMGV